MIENFLNIIDNNSDQNLNYFLFIEADNDNDSNENFDSLKDINRFIFSLSDGFNLWLSNKSKFVI